MNIDIFKNDAFALRSLTESINKIPPRFSYLGQIPGLFQERGISTTTTEIEEREGRLSLVPASVRGTRGEAIPRSLRKMRPFKTAHLQFNDEILADDVLNVRQFGSTDQLRPVLDLVAEKLQTAADSMEITLEYMRLGAVKGVVYDANGNVLNDMFEEFDQKQRKQTWTIPATNTGYLKQRCSDIIRSTQKILGGDVVQRYELLCGDEIFDAIESSPEIIDVNRFRNNNEFLVQSHAMRAFDYCGIKFVNYQGYVGETTFIDTDKAYLLPIGVSKMFLSVYAPADYTETVGTQGIKYYAKQEPKPFAKGIDIECQSNPLILCTRPAALLEVSLG